MPLFYPTRIDVYHHVDGGTQAAIQQVLTLLRELNRKADSIMADTQATLAKLAAATESLAGIRQDITDLKALIAAGGTPQEVSDAVDALAASMASLDAENPTP